MTWLGLNIWWWIAGGAAIIFGVFAKLAEMNRESEFQEKMQQGMMRDYNRSIDVLNQSIELAKNSKNFETRKNNIAVAIEVVTRLLEDYPEETNLHEVLASCLIAQKDIHMEALSANLQKCCDKANGMKSVSAKINNAGKALALLEEAKRDTYVNTEQVDIWIQSMNEYISKVEYENMQHKAEKLEFKCQTDKALDAYQDMLFHLKTDCIDDEQQAEQFTTIQKKVEELKAAPEVKKPKRKKSDIPLQ